MVSPYRGLPRKSYWKSGVVQKPQGLTSLYTPRFPIEPAMKIVTAGSCFAQHIAARMKARGYQVVDAEPAPPGLPLEVSKKYGYNLYSARYGNIYTVRQLHQLLQEAFGLRQPHEVVWEKDGRYYDALRPSVEPDGLDSPEEVLAHRADHLRRVAAVLDSADLLIFTLGLTEAWVDREDGTVFPTAPETIAGSFDPARYEFKNLTVNEVVADFDQVRSLLKARNPGLRFLLTVSPVPLTATATEHHVLTATIYSKSVLRAAAGEIFDTYPDVDYFPSYEIIGTPFVGAEFYEPDLRSVAPKGVQQVMELFFASQPSEQPTPADGIYPNAASPDNGNHTQEEPEESVICEDALLEAFGR